MLLAFMTRSLLFDERNPKWSLNAAAFSLLTTSFASSSFPFTSLSGNPDFYSVNNVPITKVASEKTNALAPAFTAGLAAAGVVGRSASAPGSSFFGPSNVVTMPTPDALPLLDEVAFFPPLFDFLPLQTGWLDTHVRSEPTADSNNVSMYR